MNRNPHGSLASKAESLRQKFIFSRKSLSESSEGPLLEDERSMMTEFETLPSPTFGIEKDISNRAEFSRCSRYQGSLKRKNMMKGTGQLGGTTATIVSPSTLSSSTTSSSSTIGSQSKSSSLFEAIGGTKENGKTVKASHQCTTTSHHDTAPSISSAQEIAQVKVSGRYKMTEKCEIDPKPVLSSSTNQQETVTAPWSKFSHLVQKVQNDRQKEQERHHVCRRPSRKRSSCNLSKLRRWNSADWIQLEDSKLVSKEVENDGNSGGEVVSGSKSKMENEQQIEIKEVKKKRMDIVVEGLGDVMMEKETREKQGNALSIADHMDESHSYGRAEGMMSESSVPFNLLNTRICGRCYAVYDVSKAIPIIQSDSGTQTESILSEADGASKISVMTAATACVTSTCSVKDVTTNAITPQLTMIDDERDEEHSSMKGASKASGQTNLELSGGSESVASAIGTNSQGMLIKNEVSCAPPLDGAIFSSNTAPKTSKAALVPSVAQRTKRKSIQIDNVEVPVCDKHAHMHEQSTRRQQPIEVKVIQKNLSGAPLGASAQVPLVSLSLARPTQVSNSSEKSWMNVEQGSGGGGKLKRNLAFTLPLQGMTGFEGGGGRGGSHLIETTSGVKDGVQNLPSSVGKKKVQVVGNSSTCVSSNNNGVSSVGGNMSQGSCNTLLGQGVPSVQCSLACPISGSSGVTGTTAMIQGVGANQPSSNQNTIMRESMGNKNAPVSVSNSVELSSTTGRNKSSTFPSIDNKNIVGIKNAEKRRRFFAKKQTYSAPDSYEVSSAFNTMSVIHTTRKLCGHCKEPVTNCLDGVLKVTRREKVDTSTITPSVEVWESEIRTARCGNVSVTHVSELDFPDADPPCHFCSEQASTAIHDESRLQIVSGGLVRSRDGSTRSGSAPYINLPSPNVQAEDGQQGVFGSLDLSPSMSQTLSPGSQHIHIHQGQHRDSQQSARLGYSLSSGRNSETGVLIPGKDEEETLVAPPASSLTRRPALVPPKLIPDPDYENDADRDKNCSRYSEDNTNAKNRRSSIVVIPPMQICPGDLLVYGKVLSQRKSLLGTTIESPSPVTSVFETDNTSTRKGKATWSLLKLFERGSRAKGGHSGTLEEIMGLIQPCEFSDPKLTRFKGMCWSDFVSHVTNKKCSKSESTFSINSGSSSEGSQTVVDNDGGGENNSNMSATQGFSSTSSCVPCGGMAAGMMSTPLSSSSGKNTTATSSSLISPTMSGGKSKASPKPLVRKRMGLMRTMSDRYLEKRITPALLKASPGFRLGEKLVEGKETETTGGTTSGPGIGNNAGEKSGGKDGSKSGIGGKPPLVPTKSEKDFFPKDQNKENVVVDEASSSNLDVRQKLRQKEALWDLFQSECSFLYDHLMVLKNVFLEPMKRIQVEGFAMYAEPELLFGNLDELCAVTYGFCKDFINLLLKLTDSNGELSTTEVLAKLFEPSSKARAMSQAYHRYALNYINALNYLETLRRHAEFCDFEKLCMRDPRCKKLQLTDLLVSPVQHLMKVPLILKDIQCRTNETQEKEMISQILEIQENSIRELDDKMKWLKNFERLLEIQRNIVWPSILEMEPKTWVPEFLRTALSRQPCDSLVVSPRRQIIHEGLLQLWDTGKPSETYVILFDDMLLITRRKKGLSKKKSSLTENWQSACGKSSTVGGTSESNHRYIVYRQPISLDRFFIHDIAEAENPSAKMDYAFVLVSLNRFQQIIAVHTFQAPSEQIKNTWLLKLKTTQDKWKRTLQNTVFRGVRSSTDSGQSNVASSLVLGGISRNFLRCHEN